VKNAELFIYDQIGYDWWSGGGITANGFIRDFNALVNDDEVESITIRINSPGGSIAEGVAIYNAIGRSTKPVNTIIDGIAWSMAAVIALAGSNVKMANNATFLLHCASGGIWGNAKDLDSTSEMLKAIDTGLANSLADKTGLTVDEVKAKWFDYTDHTLTAKQAFDDKLIDEVVSSQSNIPKDIANWSKDKVFNYFSSKADAGKKEGWIDQIKNLFKNQSLQTPNNLHEGEDSNKKNNKDDMNIQEFENVKGLAAENITPEQITAINTKLKAEGIEGVEIVTAGTVENLNQQIVAAKEKGEDNTEKINVADFKNQIKALTDMIAKIESPEGETKPKGDDNPPGAKNEFIPSINSKS
jgi:ATP-dependent Clp endopeptidase proteolytic subunit ClpP